MLRSGLILGVVMLIAGGLLAFVFPLCVPCLALVGGAAAGYLAGQWDRPADNGRAMQRGAGAGAIAGVGAWLGHLAGGLGSAVYIGPQQAAQMLRDLGFDPGVTGEVSPAVYYASATLTGCCFGVFEVALMALLGLVGGMVWWNMSGKSQGGAGALPPNLPA